MIKSILKAFAKMKLQRYGPKKFLEVIGIAILGAAISSGVATIIIPDESLTDEEIDELLTPKKLEQKPEQIEEKLNKGDEV